MTQLVTEPELRPRQRSRGPSPGRPRKGRAIVRGAVILAVALGGRVVQAQRPDTVRARADSARLADSLALLRELQRRAADTTARGAVQGPGPANPRLLPDISVVGDFVADLSSGGSTQEDETRIGVREVELQAIAAVDPYFRGEVLASWSEAEGATLEQAIMTTTALPWGLQVRIGRIPVPFGKLNILHREALQTIEFPSAIQRFLSPEGLKANSVVLSGIWAPFGFYQELLASIMDRFGEAPEDLAAGEPPNRSLKGLGYGARLRNYWDLTQNANLELSASFATALHEQPLDVTSPVNAVLARQTLVGLDLTYRWRPLQQGLYRSLIVQAEVFRQLNQADPELPDGLDPEAYLGPRRGFDGGFLFGRYQLSRRTYVGSGIDLLEDPEVGGEVLRAVSGYLQLLPSEFSKLVAGYEWRMPEGGAHHGRLLLQATFAIGPHRPHPF